MNCKASLPLCVALFAACHFPPVMAQTPNAQDRPVLLTVQSELDYLAASKTRISVELKQATPREILDEVARKAKLQAEFEGPLSVDKKHDVSFKDLTVKEVLASLSDRLEVSYRVMGPKRLRIIANTDK